MDVSCPQCATLFELDDDQLSSGSVALQCSQCQHLFRFQSKAENHRRWMLKSVSSGDILYFNTFDVLHGWMMAQRVSREDEISRSGDKWVTLGSIGEFTPVFQVLDSIKDLLPKSPDKDPFLELPEELRTQKPKRIRTTTVQQFAGPGTESKSVKSNTETARVPFPKRESVDSTGSLEIPWEMSSEIHIRNPHVTKTKSNTILKAFFSVLFLGIFGVGIWYLMNMKRQTQVISIGDEAPLVAKNSRTKVENTAAHVKSLPKEKAPTKEQELSFQESRDSIVLAVKKATKKAKKKESSENAEVILKKGLRALEKGNLSLARGSFIRVLDQKPRNSEAITGLGWVKLESGSAKGAAREFRRALKINPSYGEAYMGLGQSLRESGNYKGAHSAYGRYLSRYPNGSRASIARYQQLELSKKIKGKKVSEAPSVED